MNVNGVNNAVRNKTVYVRKMKGKKFRRFSALLLAAFLSVFAVLSALTIVGILAAAPAALFAYFLFIYAKGELLTFDCPHCDGEVKYALKLRKGCPRCRGPFDIIIEK